MKKSYYLNLTVFQIFLVLFFIQFTVKGQNNYIEVIPETYNNALRNPLKGFTTRGIYDHKWATLAQDYIKWNEIEDDESDGIDKIIQVIDEKWQGIEERNIKIIPRIYLHWTGDQTYWPSDMTTGDYTSEQFKERVQRLIDRLGVVWDSDPRVAFIEMGIFGKWGEQHSPFPSVEMESVVANAFADAFPNKLVSVRRNWERFKSQPFGEYWDSWAHYDQMWPHGNSIAELNNSDNRYLSNYIGGEAAYNWGNSIIQPGPSPTESVANPIHRNFIINSIRWLHCTQLRWIEDYDQTDSLASEGAELIQKAFGYRYIIEKVKFTSTITNNVFQVELGVKNTGSAPFYYDWPIEVSLLDTNTHSVLWSDVFSDTDIRDWLPGQGWASPDWTETTNWSKFYPDATWSSTTAGWSTPPATYTETNNFEVDLPTGQYILALSILDPAGMLPSLRFATSQYFNGGRHPIGLVAVNEGQGGFLPEDLVFDDPAMDNSLNYVYNSVPVNSVPLKIDYKSPQNKLRIFPNPTQNNVTISSESKDIRSVKIVDTSGRIILINSPEDKTCSIDVSTINEGLYLATIYFTDKTLSTKKIVIK